MLIAECARLPSSDAVVIGYQVVAILDAPNEVLRLYVSQRMDLNASISLQVEEDGVYWVTIFAITEDRGILNFMTVHSQQVMVSKSKVAGVYTSKPKK